MNIWIEYWEKSLNRVPLAMDSERAYRRVKMSATSQNELLPQQTGPARQRGFERRRVIRILNVLLKGVLYGHDYCEWSPARGSGT
jgi:hypothetical protein